jgi:hypothetical protein
MLNRQHNDMGAQYRSAIFYTDGEQKKAAERVKTQWDKSGKFNRPITTEIAPATKFYPAEEYHQRYLVKNPGGCTCHVLREPRRPSLAEIAARESRSRREGTWHQLSCVGRPGGRGGTTLQRGRATHHRDH